MKKPILLIDGDILLYRCGFAAEHTHYLVTWDRDPNYYTAHTHKEATALTLQDGTPGTIWNRKEVQPLEFALNNVNTVLESFVQKFDPSDVRTYLSDDKCFRDTLAKTKPYKGNRDSAAKPKHYKAIREYLLSRGAIIKPNLEADDVLGIEQGKLRGQSIIVSIDKDLDQISGKHYNWVEGNLYDVGPRAADYTLFGQILSGDATDNVPGLPKMGPVTAGKILDGATNRRELYDRVRKVYDDGEYFAEQAGLVFILREEGKGWADFESAILNNA